MDPIVIDSYPTHGVHSGRKTVIAGSRDITSYDVVALAVKMSWFDISEVVSGKARGVDALGEEYAKKNGLRVKSFPADWNKHGKSAGPIRNAEMARYADQAIIIWDGHSTGTKNMIEQMKKLKKPCFVFMCGWYWENYNNGS